jgi:hypothetical protein
LIQFREAFTDLGAKQYNCKIVIHNLYIMGGYILKYPHIYSIIAVDVEATVAFLDNV